MSNVELMPCPFCKGSNGNRVICYEQRFSKDDYRWVVVCECGATIIGDGWQKQTNYQTREEAIKAWNTRI